jgi:hypothetical protein
MPRFRIDHLWAKLFYPALPAIDEEHQAHGGKHPRAASPHGRLWPGTPQVARRLPDAIGSPADMPAGFLIRRP